MSDKPSDTGAKAKAISSGLFDKAKKTVMRAKQQILVKVGASEQTIDIQFDQERARFKEHYKAVQKLAKDTDTLMKVLKDLSIIQNTLAEDFYNMYETKAELYNASLKNQDVAKYFENARAQLEEQMKEDFLVPLRLYLGQFAEMSDRIERRDTRKVDMDRYAHDVKKAQEKYDPGKLEVNSLKYETMKLNYNNLNMELLEDLPALYEDRLTFFNPLLATYMTTFSEYYRQCAKHSAEMLYLVADVDKKAAATHPRATTETEESSANPKNEQKPDMNKLLDRRASVSMTKTVVATPSAPPDEDEPVARAAAPAKKAAVPPAPSKGVRAKALYDFNPSEEGELGFKVNDIIMITKQEGEWWEGEFNGRRGVLPSNYVQLL